MGCGFEMTSALSVGKFRLEISKGSQIGEDFARFRWVCNAVAAVPEGWILTTGMTRIGSAIGEVGAAVWLDLSRLDLGRDGPEFSAWRIQNPESPSRLTRLDLVRDVFDPKPRVSESIRL